MVDIRLSEQLFDLVVKQMVGKVIDGISYAGWRPFRIHVHIGLKPP